MCACMRACVLACVRACATFHLIFNSLQCFDISGSFNINFVRSFIVLLFTVANCGKLVVSCSYVIISDIPYRKFP